MALMDVQKEPTGRELAVFAGLWTVFFPALGWIVAGADAGVLAFAAVAAVCFALAAAFNRELSTRERLVGAGAPVAALVIWGALRAMQASGMDEATVRTACLAVGAAVGIAGGAAAIAARAAGVWLYRGWMLAVLPLGWTFSHALLAVVFFGVILPIGAVMLLSGRDPMERRMRSGASSYWKARRQEQDPRRYLRQF